MTTDNKTLAVDVLGVMDAAQCALEIDARSEQAEEINEARAAVAELIDVASRFDSYKSSDFVDTSILDNEDLWNRLSAALARVKGE